MHRWLLLCLLLLPARAPARDIDRILEAAEHAASALDTPRALALLHQADTQQPNTPLILQRLARQYSDLVPEQTTVEEKRRYARLALDYAQRAAALQPTDPINVLSLAICHGTLAVYSDTRTKIAYSRLVHEEASRALQLDPHYAWAHHVMGRWHYEVASLGTTSRWLVRLLYGKLPAASLDTGISHLRRACALEPAELNHMLELGFAYAAAQQSDLARQAWQQGLAMPARGKHDEPAKQRAREALRLLD